jgi:hypothetical protein
MELFAHAYAAKITLCNMVRGAGFEPAIRSKQLINQQNLDKSTKKNSKNLTE